MLRYDDPVRAGAKAARELADLITDDLDPSTTGIGWWAGYSMPAEVRGWLSYYLVGSARAVAANLEDAAVHLTNYRDAVRREDIFYARRVRATTGMADMRNRNGLDAKRMAEINADRGGFFRAVGSVLDTLAAVVIGVGALDTNIVKADWSTLNTGDAADSYPRTAGDTNRRLRRSLADQATRGGTEQDRLLRAVRATMQFAGPPGWDTWTLAMRNSLVHRSRWMDLHIQVDRRKPEAGLYRPLPRQPELSEGQVMQRDGQPFDFVLSEDAGTTMTGVLGSVVPVVQTVTETCTNLWAKRRTAPSLLEQPYDDRLPQPVPPFAGYAPDSIAHAIKKDMVIVVGREDGPRFAALKPRNR
ncbi:hypothetical protein [Nocardia thraciensis]